MNYYQLSDMNFSDSQLQQSYDLNLAAAVGSSEEAREVCALMAVHEFFEMIEGPHSARVHEIIDRLLSPGVRVALRGWYRQRGIRLDASASIVRNRLNLQTGERLELEEDLPPTPLI